jgi:hypothetical protein
MSVGRFLQQAAAGNAGGDPVYVDDVFSTYLYTGDGSTGSTTSITNGIDLSGEGGLVWIKKRDENRNHFLVDTARGVNQTLGSDRDITPQNTVNSVTAFNSNGFSLGSEGGVNEGGGGYVSWTFRKQPGFFDVVTYTGNGSARTISHNLGSVPGMILVKNLSGAYNWTVYHNGMGGYNYYNHLNNTDSRYNNTAIWNATPTSTVFSVGTSANTNENGNSYVAYLFAHDAQDFGTDEDEAIIKCGSYEGTNANHDVDLGFEPQWVLVKNIDAAGNWEIYDVMRGMPSGTNARYIRADSSAAENGTVEFYPTSSGFTVTGSNTNTNSNGHTFIYVAIRRPHKPASEFAATDLFAVDNNTTSTSAGFPNFVSGFPVDMGLANTVDETGYTALSSRLTGKQMYTPASDAEEGSPEYDYSTGFKEGGSSTNADEYGWMWRRSPGFFDAVAYKGVSSGVVKHNLGVKPELVIIKQRNAINSNNRHWAVGAPDILGINANTLSLNNTYANGTLNYNMFDTTAGQTATQIKLHGNENGISSTSGNYIAYLFATVAGISKVGSYTGTGNDLNVDCGFSAGARFVLVKRTDSTGDWYLWDSSRGIVAGNDPYLLLNSTAAHITNTDYVDPLASGFTVTSSAPAALNTSGGTYIFYAIA